MAAATEFGLDDHVRFIGTDAIRTVRNRNAETLEYLVQSGKDEGCLVELAE